MPFWRFHRVIPETAQPLLGAIAYIAVCWGFLYFLYRQRIFLKSKIITNGKTHKRLESLDAYEDSIFFFLVALGPLAHSGLMGCGCGMAE